MSAGGGPVSAEVAAILDRAADRIERDGWWQGAGAYSPTVTGAMDPKLLRGRREPCCVMGALHAEAPTSLRRELASDALTAVIGQYPISWNDAPGRTQVEVVAALREAARRERAS